MPQTLWQAARDGDVAAVQQMVEAGAALERENPWDNHPSPLIAAARSGLKYIVDVLLQAGADVNAGDMYQLTAMMGAANKGHVEVVEALVGAGGQVDAVDMEGNTALYYAAIGDQLTTVQALLSHGADRDVKNQQGQTACDDAKLSGHVAVVTALEEASGARAAPKVPLPVDDGYHVMLSYQWEHQDTVKKVSAALKAAGFRVWLDIEQMSGAINDAMAEAVDHASVVLVCMSNKYRESKNCKREAEYADKRNVPLIPLKMERGYKPEGWLEFIIGARLYYDFSGKYPFEEKLNDLVEEIKKIKRTGD